MKLYTGFGDAGKTALFGGDVVPKNNLRVETYGTLDELNSFIGLLRVKNKNQKVDELLHTIQNELFIFGSETATPDTKKSESFKEHIGKKHIEALETAIDFYSDQVAPLKQFVLPGGSEAAALAHVARTICRRAERMLIRLHEQENIRVELIVYLNRLSDLLFAVARYQNKLNDREDVAWTGIR